MFYKKLVIIDYKMGNISSVYNALKYLNIPVQLTNNKKKIKESSGIILPGVGSFGDAVKNIKELNIFELLITELNKGKPYLGICLGLQLLFERSEEYKKCKGFSIFKGEVVRFKEKGIKIPHIGWNQILIKRKNPMYKNIKNNSYFYFVHSYYAKPKDNNIVSTTTFYGEEFVSSIYKDNIYAVQFHPEKSQEDGLKLIKNFADFCFK